VFGFFKAEDASLEFYNHLVQNWGIKSKYVLPFVSAYKEEISKLYKSGKKRFQHIKKLQIDSVEASKTVNEEELQLDLTLVEQAFIAYRRDFMRGNMLERISKKWCGLF